MRLLVMENVKAGDLNNLAGRKNCDLIVEGTTIDLGNIKDQLTSSSHRLGTRCCLQIVQKRSQLVAGKRIAFLGREGRILVNLFP